MIPAVVRVALVVVALLIAVPAHAEPPRLEQLDGEVAFTRVSAGEGVTLVDLYADW